MFTLRDALTLILCTYHLTSTVLDVTSCDRPVLQTSTTMHLYYHISNIHWHQMEHSNIYSTRQGHELKDPHSLVISWNINWLHIHVRWMRAVVCECMMAGHKLSTCHTYGTMGWRSGHNYAWTLLSNLAVRLSTLVTGHGTLQLVSEKVRKCTNCFRMSLLQLPACLDLPTPTQTGHGSRYKGLSLCVRISCLCLCSVQDMMLIDKRNCGTAEGSDTTKSQYAATTLTYTRLTAHTTCLHGFRSLSECARSEQTLNNLN